MRIVVITDEITDFLKRKMNDLNIVDLFLDSNVTIQEIIRELETKVDYTEMETYVTQQSVDLPYISEDELKKLLEIPFKFDEDGSKIIYKSI